jgi:MFS family permease
MVSSTYLVSAAVTAVLGVFLIDGSLTTWSFMAFILVIFFIASAGASSAYLTVSEIFPMETRALSIAFFYAAGTAAGGIAGPLLFGHLIASGSESQVAIGFFIGAAVMTLGGVAELLFGVSAEQEQLEDVAEPLTAEGAEEPERPAAPAQRRLRPGAARIGSPGMPVSAPLAPTAIVREVDMIDRALQDRGSANRRELARRVGARYWGPGRFGVALRTAISQGRVKRLRGGEYAAAEHA